MRLIDADNFMGFMTALEDAGAEYVPFDDLRKFINNQPTAYDVDKVVEQLEECKRIMLSPVNRDCYGEECKVEDCLVCTFEKAIEIAKAGGVNE